MNRLFIRLLVAFLAFALSLVLTGFKKFLTLDPPEPLMPIENVVAVSDHAADKLQMCEIYAQYGPAQRRRDRAFFERVETEDFIFYLNHDYFTRDQDILWMEQQSSDLVYEIRLDHLDVFGNTAVGHGVMEVRDGDKVQQYPFTDIWVKQSSGWRIQITHQTGWPD
jgi:uncharacterized protein DUF4440